MSNEANPIFRIDNTRFIYSTNFSGNPENDRFGDMRRKANLIIPDPDMAMELRDQGFKVRETKPRESDDIETFQPTYFVTPILKYRDRTGRSLKYPPEVHLVHDDGRVILLSEDEVGKIDRIRVKNVNVILNSYTYDEANNGKNLYIRTMYVEQDLNTDPYAEMYMGRREE